MIGNLMQLPHLYTAAMEPLLNIPRIYTGIAEWLFSLIFIIFAEKRFTGIRLYAIIIGFLAVICGFQILAGILPLYLWIPGMVFAVALMMAFILVAADVNIFKAGYLVVQAFVIAEFTASFQWQIYYYAVEFFKLDFQFLSELLLIIIYSIVFYIIYLLESRYRKKGLIIDVQQNDLLTFLGIATIIFFISNISFISVNTPLSGRYPAEIFYIRTLVDFAGIVILYSQREHKVVVNSLLEINQMEVLLRKQYEQYATYQESMDIINQKYHDLKNQLVAIREEKDLKKRELYLQEMEDDIKWYEAQYKTGNQVLDTLLTTKNLTCISHNINMSCIADGSLLSFISTVDLCSIFGNALDNAIEGVSEIEDPDKRLIKIAVFSQKDLLLIRFENYFVNRLSYVNGNLTTTKESKTLHGFGLKGIRNIVDKYHGSVSINTDNNWFNLTLLIPITKNKE